MSDLRAAYQNAVQQNAPHNRDGCPTADQLSALAASMRVGDNAAESAMLEHVLTCARCQPEFNLLRTAQMAGAPPRARFRFTVQQVGLAAALLLAVGVGGSVWEKRQAYASRATPADVSDVVLVSPASDATSPLATRFLWRAVSGAVTYQWEVLDSAGTVVVQAITADTTAQLTAADSARVAALTFFDWMVTARRTDGNERRSALVRVRVR